MFKKIKTSLKTFKEKRKRKKQCKEHGNGDSADETSTYRNYSEKQSSGLHYPTNYQSVYLRQTRSTGDLLKVPSYSPTSLEAQSQLSLQPQGHKTRNSWIMLNNNNKKAEKQRLEEQKQLEKQRIEWLKKLEKQRIENEKRMDKLLMQERASHVKIEEKKEKIQEKQKELEKIEIPAPKEPLNDALPIQSIRHHDFAALDQASTVHFKLFFGQVFTQLFFLFAMLVVFITFLRFLYVLGLTIYKLKLVW